MRRSWRWRKKGKARTPFGSRSSRRRFCEMRLNSLPSNALPVMKRAWNAERHARRDDLVPFGFGRIHVMPFKLSQRSGRCEGGWVAGDRRVTLATSTPKGGGGQGGAVAPGKDNSGTPPKMIVRGWTRSPCSHATLTAFTRYEGGPGINLQEARKSTRTFTVCHTRAKKASFGGWGKKGAIDSGERGESGQTTAGRDRVRNG